MTFDPIPVSFPFTEKDTTVFDDYFGTRVADPYRWLEDDQSAETKDWVQKQNLVTNGYLSQVPFRDKIKKRLEEIWNFEKFGTPFKKADKYYYFKNDGLQNQSVLYVQNDLDAKAEVLLDPNTFSADGTSSLQEMAFSKDGNYLAYAVSAGGSDWRTIQVMDLRTRKMLSDEVKWRNLHPLPGKEWVLLQPVSGAGRREEPDSHEPAICNLLPQIGHLPGERQQIV
ncbi:MAG: hypothetical protein R2792_13115 [Saprospiraceae bacterium]